MTAIVVSVAFGVGLLIALLLVVRQVIRGMAASGKARVLALAGSTPLLVDPSAICFGFESMGVTQLRGNGSLVYFVENKRT